MEDHVNCEHPLGMSCKFCEGESHDHEEHVSTPIIKDTMLHPDLEEEFIERARNGEGTFFVGGKESYITDPNHQFVIRVEDFGCEPPHACYVPFVGY